jgi:hypothetical protein
VLDQGDPVPMGGRWESTAPTLITLSSSRVGVPEGEPLALSAHVHTVHGRGAPPTGSVAFVVGLRVLGTATLDGSGRAVLSGITLPTGVHAITASYGGDASHAAASSTPLPQAVVAMAAPVVVAITVPDQTPHGTRLQAQLIDPVSGRLIEDARGEVLFVAGGEEVARATLIAGLAQAVVPRLPEGALRAVFAGDDDHAAASGHLYPVEP